MAQAHVNVQRLRREVLFPMWRQDYLRVRIKAIMWLTVLSRSCTSYVGVILHHGYEKRESWATKQRLLIYCLVCLMLPCVISWQWREEWDFVTLWRMRVCRLRLHLFTGWLGKLRGVSLSGLSTLLYCIVLFSCDKYCEWIMLWGSQCLKTDVTCMRQWVQPETSNRH